MPWQTVSRRSHALRQAEARAGRTALADMIRRAGAVQFGFARTPDRMRTYSITPGPPGHRRAYPPQITQVPCGRIGWNPSNISSIGSRTSASVAAPDRADLRM